MSKSTSTFYDHNQVEAKWQKIWQDLDLFQNTALSNQLDSGSQSFQLDHSRGLVSGQIGMTAQSKMYLLFAFAYPSGSGLHVGHVESKTALDILARYYRMNGRDVFFPVGWDAFGLPAANYAIKIGIPPL